jgi:hypothetical protein
VCVWALPCPLGCRRHALHWCVPGTQAGGGRARGACVRVCACAVCVRALGGPIWQAAERGAVLWCPGCQQQQQHAQHGVTQQRQQQPAQQPTATPVLPTSVPCTLTPTPANRSHCTRVARRPSQRRLLTTRTPATSASRAPCATSQETARCGGCVRACWLCRWLHAALISWVALRPARAYDAVGVVPPCDASPLVGLHATHIITHTAHVVHTRVRHAGL